MQQHILNALSESQKALQNLLENQATLQQIERAGTILSEAFQRRQHVYSCGNGGSMCDAMHFAEELAGRFRRDRPALGAMALSDPSYLTCTANDYGYDAVFSRGLEAMGRPGDVLLAISTSGKSRNIILAAETAKRLGMHVIALTGSPQGPIAELADIHICTPSGTAFADRVQELHIKCIHILIELVERQLFKETYEAKRG